VAYTLRTTWPDAENHCVAKGGHLTSIESVAEEHIVLSTIRSMCSKSTTAFIGYSASAHEGGFEWQGRGGAEDAAAADEDASSKPPLYTRWSYDLGGEDYTEVVVATGLWNDVSGETDSIVFHTI
jgi:hypothetical protein